MSAPGNARLMKGAIVGIDPMNPVATVIAFQYNPDQLTRSLQPQTAANEGGDFAEALRLKGPPIETFQLEVQIDATDQLDNANSQAVQYGIYPQLSALEMLVYPKSVEVISRQALLAAGTIEVLMTYAPLTLLVWGVNRVLPVRVDSFSITEDNYDVNLNPIRAKAALSLRVLNYNDFSMLQPGYHLFLAHQVLKETMASLNTFNTVGVNLGSLGIK